MTNRRRLTKGIAQSSTGSFRLARWASIDDNVRRLKAYVRRIERQQLHDSQTLKLKHLPWLRMKRQWRERLGVASQVRVRWPR